ncbi:MAG TPA: hypothetical protein VKS81_05155 [Bacteroidota bacterium]|nr:hypothetical protein [Bacteroidota bacterium]
MISRLFSDGLLTRFKWKWGTFLALFLATLCSKGFSQDLVVGAGASFSGSGVYKIRGNIDNGADTSHANPADTIKGTVKLLGAVAESIGVSSGKPIQFDKLAVDSSAKFLNVTVSVETTLTLTGGSLGVHGHALNIDGGTAKTNGALTANGATDVVNYRGSNAQSIIGTTYGNLTLSGTGAKNLGGKTIAGTVNHSGGNLTVNDSLTVTNAGTFATISDVTDSSALLFTGNGSDSIATVSNVSSATGAITNNSTGRLGIGTVTNIAKGTITSGNGDISFGTATIGGDTTGYGTIKTTSKNLIFGTLAGNKGTLQTSGVGNITITGNTVNSATISAAAPGSGAITFGTLSSNSVINSGAISGGSGGIVFNAAVTNTFNIGSPFTGTITFNSTVNNTGGLISDPDGNSLLPPNSGSVIFNNDFAPGQSGTLVFGAKTTVTYAGNTTRVDSGVYGNLTLAGSLNKTSTKSFGMAGVLSLGKNLTMGTNTLTMSDTLGSNVTGTGEIDGTVKRTNTLNAGEFYTFNNDSVGLALKHTSSSQLAMNMSPDTVFGSAPSTRYVNRAYRFAGAAPTDTLSGMSLIYTNNELVNITTETKLGVRDYNGTSWSKVTGFGYVRSVDTVSNIVDVTNVSTPLSTVTEFALATTAFTTVASNKLWNDPTLWDEHTVPGSTDDAEIDHPGISVGVIDSIGTVTMATDSSAVTVNGSLLVGSITDPLTLASFDNEKGTVTVNGTLSVRSTFLNKKSLVVNTLGTLSVRGKLTNFGTVANSGVIDIGQ